MTSLEIKLAEKITVKQNLVNEMYNAQIELDNVIYEINKLKDEIITEYEKRIEENLQEIEDLEKK